MTFEPAWGGELTGLIKTVAEEFRRQDGLTSVLRATVVDIREGNHPPFRKRTGVETDLMFRSFEACASAGADLLAIESTGGKDVTDRALPMADIPGLLYGPGILAPADMSFLWDRIVSIAERHGRIASGDTACGFANTAMVLADRRYIPKVLASLVRALTVPRSLVAYEEGAVGPGKDCGYENPHLKLITGFPMSLEGKSAACAHLSSLGNIAAAYADLWSNESVQNTKLLSDMAPVVSMEQLIYDCRLMNQALSEGREHLLQRWLVDSDALRDPQAFILSPEAVRAVAEAVIAERDPYLRCLRAGRTALDLLTQASSSQGRLPLSPKERDWLDRLKGEMDNLPDDPQRFVEETGPAWEELVSPQEYGL